MDRAQPPFPLRWALLLGFALGGFFDGVLLHQILQWHHLLSLVPGVDGLAGQVLWDGLFHALMYVLGALGLWGLWRAERRGGTLPGRRLAAGLLLGFGLWHVVDSVVSHWVLGLHRIRVDAANPLAWDVAWLLVFGIVPIGLGWMLDRGGPSGRAGPRVALLALLAGGMGGWALRPPADQAYTLVVFRPGLEQSGIESAVAGLGWQVLWSEPGTQATLIDLPDGQGWRLYGAGALIVSGAGLPAGCLGWSRDAGEA